MNRKKKTLKKERNIKTNITTKNVLETNYELDSFIKSYLNYVSYILPKSVKAILNKSKFKEDIYKPFNLLFYIRDAENINSALISLYEIYPKTYMSLDAFNLFYFDIDLLRFYKKKSENIVWDIIMEELLNDENIEKLNKISRGDKSLAKAFAIRLLYTLLDNLADDKYKSIKQILYAKNVSQISYVDNNTIKQNVEELINNVKEELKQDVEKVIDFLNYFEDVKVNCKCLLNINFNINDLADTVEEGTSHGYTLEGLSVLLFDDYLRYVANKNLSRLEEFLKFYKRFRNELESNIEKLGVETQFGYLKDIEKMRNLSDLKNIAYSSLCDNYVMNIIKIANYNALRRVYEKQNKFVIYIDKSGSMMERIYSNNKSTNYYKIDVACALGLYLYRKYKAKMYFFDTEVHEVSDKDVIKFLMRIKASGGTNIERVLIHIYENNLKCYNIIITDAISDIENKDNWKIVEKLSKLDNVRVIVLPPAEFYEWLKKFKYFVVNNVEEFIKISKEIIKQ